jgi:hypothetical protein
LRKYVSEARIKRRQRLFFDADRFHEDSTDEAMLKFQGLVAGVGFPRRPPRTRLGHFIFLANLPVRKVVILVGYASLCLVQPWLGAQRSLYAAFW